MDNSTLMNSRLNLLLNEFAFVQIRESIYIGYLRVNLYNYLKKHGVTEFQFRNGIIEAVKTYLSITFPKKYEELEKKEETDIMELLENNISNEDRKKLYEMPVSLLPFHINLVSRIMKFLQLKGIDLFHHKKVSPKDFFMNSLKEYLSSCGHNITEDETDQQLVEALKTNTTEDELHNITCGCNKNFEKYMTENLEELTNLEKVLTEIENLEKKYSNKEIDPEEDIIGVTI